MQPPWSTAQSTITERGFIVRTIASLTTWGARPPGTSTAPIDEVGVGDRAGDRSPVAGEGHDPALVDLVDPPEPVEVLVEQQHLGLHALRDPRCVPPDVARAEHDDPRRADAGCAPEQHPAAAVLALEEVRPDLRRHPARDLAHRREEREAARSRAAPSRTRSRSRGARGARRPPPGTRRGGGT